MGDDAYLDVTDNQIGQLLRLACLAGCYTHIAILSLGLVSDLGSSLRGKHRSRTLDFVSAAKRQTARGLGDHGPT